MRSFVLFSATAVAIFACAAGYGAEPGAGRNRPLSFEEEVARVQALALAAHEKAMRSPAGKIDSEPPALVGIATIGSVNTQLPNQTIEIDLNIRDNLSGVTEYGIQYISPSGTKTVYRYKDVVTPLTHLSPTLNLGTWPFTDPGFTVFDEPGTWRANYFYVTDAQGNYRDYGPDELATLGGSTFLVMSSGYDITPPSLASGTIDTPVVRRSKPPKGTSPGTPPFVNTTLNVTDAGNGLIAGTYRVNLQLCHPIGGGQCDGYMYLQGTTNRTGLAATSMPVATQMQADQTLGQYVIQYIDLEDLAGNSYRYLSQDFGGDTDFTKLFPNGATVFVTQ